MSLRDDVLNCLASEHRNIFLAAVAHDLTIGARGGYAMDGQSPNESNAWLRCSNELLHNVTGALLESLAGEPSYPDDVLYDVLVSKADAFGGCCSILEHAFERALKGVMSHA